MPDPSRQQLTCIDSQHGLLKPKRVARPRQDPHSEQIREPETLKHGTKGCKPQHETNPERAALLQALLLLEEAIAGGGPAKDLASFAHSSGSSS